MVKGLNRSSNKLEVVLKTTETKKVHILGQEVQMCSSNIRCEDYKDENMRSLP